MAVQNSSATQPYKTLDTTMTLLDGPFQANAAFISTNDTDVCNVRFMNTMNSLTSSGRMTSSIYYSSPNATFALPYSAATPILS